MKEVRASEACLLDSVYAVVFLDAVVVKVRDNQAMSGEPAYLTISVDGVGEKHVLGIWLARTPLQMATAGAAALF